jgi:hypothetical protein
MGDFQYPKKLVKEAMEDLKKPQTMKGHHQKLT